RALSGGDPEGVAAPDGEAVEVRGLRAPAADDRRAPARRDPEGVAVPERASGRTEGDPGGHGECVRESGSGHCESTCRGSRSAEILSLPRPRLREPPSVAPGRGSGAWP